MKFVPVLAGDPVDPTPGAANLNQILRAVRTHLEMEVGFISEFTDGCRVFRHVESADGVNCVNVGGSDPLEQSYCHWIVEGKLPQLLRDPSQHPFAAQFPVTKTLPVGAHLSVPIRLRSGEVYGTFCCFSTRPDPSLTARDLSVMEAFAQVAGDQIQQALDSDEVRQAKLSRINSMLGTRELQIVYQPAVRIDSGRVEFVEALARFRSDPYVPPDQWFAAAAEVGLGTELEMLAVTLAIEGLSELPEASSLSINVSPETVLSAELAAALDLAPLDRIILEITEHEAVKNYAALAQALAPLCQRGLRIAVDDTGAGYSSFRHIIHMRPDLIKLDMSLTRGIDGDAARRALASALIAFASDIGSELVAEGVETPGELHSLRGLGVTVIQGHIMARPAPAAELN
jgi:EAL domain-containing protein (putative c-di-GMP-specific phosphodiesterase class I)